MKTLVKITLLLLFVPSVVLANNLKGKYTKTKTINKEFTVNADALVSLSNKYGSIDIKPSNQNKVTLEIIITTSSNSESKAVDRLNSISVNISGSNSSVSAQTKFEKKSNWNLFGNNNSSSMDIKYIVKMPVSNKLDVSMDYGNVMIEKLEGRANINIDYGKLIAGELLSNNTDINLDYSRGSSVETMGDGTINIDYSSIDIQNAGNIDLNTDYSDTSFENVGDLIYNTDYGSIKAQNANSISGDSDYASLKFGKIAKSLEVSADYGSLKVEEMGQNFSKIVIDTDYIGIKIGVDANASFSYNISSKYGGISLPDNVTNTREIIKNTSKQYEGSYNGTKGNVSITTSYGSVKIYKN
ncbi:MAG: hypothetical protein BM563_05785 [Bacteroidetes bacterium MedPE-SWsnd-G1]|nr:MAG: hypothetical protein BM563_05785 [Bacteroidetes bacterium MedPE-SWsnd-G1]